MTHHRHYHDIPREKKGAKFNITIAIDFLRMQADIDRDLDSIQKTFRFHLYFLKGMIIVVVTEVNQKSVFALTQLLTILKAKANLDFLFTPTVGKIIIVTNRTTGII